MVVAVSYQDGADDADRSVLEAAISNTFDIRPKQTSNSSPVFEDDEDNKITSTTREIEENAGADATVGKVVAAIDANTVAGIPNFLTYTLSGPDAASFNIGRGEPEENGNAAVGTVLPKDVGGQITAKKDLDYETKNEYTVIVTATDGSGASASITVTINVTDEEPETPKLVAPVVNADPEFATATAAREVAEGTVLGRNVGAPVRATDADGRHAELLAERRGLA